MPTLGDNPQLTAVLKNITPQQPNNSARENKAMMLEKTDNGSKVSEAQSGHENKGRNVLIAVMRVAQMLHIVQCAELNSALIIHRNSYKRQ